MYPWAGQPPASASLMLDRILGVTPSYTWNPQLENKGKGRDLPGFHNLAFVPTLLQLHQLHPLVCLIHLTLAPSSLERKHFFQNNHS